MSLFSIVLLAVFIGGSCFYIFSRFKQTKAEGEAFLARHPDAAKVYLVQRIGITSDTTEVSSVNGEKPAMFVEGIKTGFYVTPGKSLVELCHTYTRPGVMYKTVSQTTGVVQKELETEARKNYSLNFDKETGDFSLEAI
ncbi:MAG: hypothetical protein LBD67_04470 [Candidatus Accumulibacter sp.]|nr:hypothetical protein [Accumulibacter sp.]